MHSIHDNLLVYQAVRRALRGPRARLGLLRGLSLACAVGMSLSPAHAELPVICVSGACGANATQFVSSGAATVASAGNNMTVNQTTASATLHWQSFNISSGSSVNFVQPGSDSVALNRIHQNSASQIFGSLSANGRVYLLNQNGIVFGNGAQVNVAGLIASSLDISTAALEDGIKNAALRSSPAFQLFGNGNPTGDVSILPGATITTHEGGQVLLFAPNVSNAGTIRTPGGQAVLAAGASIYLYAQDDDDLRGLWVEVGGAGGTVTNGLSSNAQVADAGELVGQIVAERGNITLAGLAVNQLGRLSATTSISQGGSIRLLARHGSNVSSADGSNVNAFKGEQGDLRLGANSRTEILLDDGGGVSVDSSVQPRSRVELDGNKVVLESGAKIIAPHGDVSVTARSDGHTEVTGFGTNAAADSRIFLADGVLIDVSGAHIGKAMESNVISVELRGDELADSPLQRNGALRGQTVQIDIRQSGTNDNGQDWVGSPMGDLSGWVANIEKDVGERSLTGGTVSLQSQGDVLLDAGSVIDISGGSITYADGYINTSQLLGADGKVYSMADANPGRVYTGLTSGTAYSVTDPRWGVTRTYIGTGSQGMYEPGYVEGKDAGSLTVLGQQALLNGGIKAETVVGRHQRNSPDVVAASALYRPYDELPLSGQLILGQTSNLVTGPNGNRDHALSDVRLANGTASQLEDGFDPWNEALAPEFNTLNLDTALFGEDRIGRFVLRANGVVTVADDVTLPAWGSLDISAGAIDVAGSLVSPGGHIGLSAIPTVEIDELNGGLTVRNGAVIDVSGRWLNDLDLVTGRLADAVPVVVDGGSVSLQAGSNSLTLEAGSLIDVSSGAQFTADGRLNTGRAGSIALGNTPGSIGQVTMLTMDGALRGHGFTDGGSLSIETAGACISSEGAACQEQGRSNLLHLNPAFFSQGGFGGYALTSNQWGVEVAPGTQIHLQQRNRLATRSFATVATGTAFEQFTTLGLLPDYERQATDLSLAVAVALPQSAPYDAASFATAGNLEIGSHATILADVGAHISLESNTRLLVDGTLDAAAGEISLKLNSDLALGASASPALYFADQGIWLGGNARLLAVGASVLVPNSLGRQVGAVLDGGHIRIDADRGHVLTSAGSLIDVSGTAATLSIRKDAQGNYAETVIGSKGGGIDVEAAEAIVIGGGLRGVSGDPGTVAGGTLRVALDATLRLDPGQQLDSGFKRSVFSDAARSIELSQRYQPVAFGNSLLPTAYVGKAMVSADQIEAGGFDALELAARTFYTEELSSTLYHFGEVNLAGDVHLDLARGLRIDAAVLSSTGGDATLAAPIVVLGNADQLYQAQLPGHSGTGELSVDAGQIDLIGNSALRGFAQTTLASAGDLRLIGVSQPGIVDELLGSFTTAGSLTLRAAQVYSTTLSDFTVTAGEAGTGSLTIARTGQAADALSAGGRLTLRAPNVIQAGTVRAPFGSITFDSPNITLTDGSVTSTSGAGLTVLFGETQGGVDWTYALSDLKTVLFGVDNAQLPVQQIVLDGDVVDFQHGATLDVSGGGELLASEFVSGTGGTLDLLGTDNRSGSFAILPANRLASAAYDESIHAGGGMEAGMSVHLSGAGDLPAGDYIVLPARYALLPGAYLVTPVSGHQDMAADERYSLADGSTLVSGYFTSTGTSLRDARTSGFAILAGGEIQNRAQYTLTNADEFFAAQAETAGLSAQRLPVDAGTVSIAAASTLNLDGRLLAAGAGGGRGAAVDIASAAIAVVAAADDSAPTGMLTLVADDLNSLGAESILLGGARTENQRGLRISTHAAQVTVAEGAVLSAPEIMLAATDTLSVAAGAAVRADGAEVAGRDVAVDGDGAFLRVATGAAGAVVRDDFSGAGGDLLLADDASLIADGGSISLESSRAATLLANLSATDGALSLTGNRISLGEASSEVDGWTLNTEQLAALDLNLLSLNSRGSIDLHGDVSLSLGSLELNAAALRGYADGAVAIHAAGDVILQGAGVGSTDPRSTAGGLLTLSANKVLFAGGALAVSGFDSVRLDAQTELRANANSRLDVAGDLALSAQRLTTASGTDLTIEAEGAASLLASATRGDMSTVTDLGGALTLAADSIQLATLIEMPSGRVNLTAASGDISLLDGAAIDVSGRSTAFADEMIDSRGGSVAMTARGGDLNLAAGSMVNIAAAGAAESGSLALSATQGALNVGGELRGTAGREIDGGSFSADAMSLGDLSALNSRLRAGGLTGELALRQRGDGDLVVAEADELRGTRVALTADQGGVRVAGGIRAHDEEGGRIILSARDGMTISGALDARAADAGERNGRIDLRVQEGGLFVTDSATLATTSAGAASGSAADGGVNLRVSQAALATVVDADAGNDQVRLAGDWSQTTNVNLEGFKVYSDDLIDAGDVTPASQYYTDAAAFAAQAGALSAALSNATMPDLKVLSGIEIRSGGSLNVNADWDLSDWHFDGRPGVLTLRAADDLIFNQSLSDGFSGINGVDSFRLTSTEDSWSYRLVAGADTASADLMAVQPVAAMTDSPGDFRIAAGNTAASSGYKMVRTGTGSIDIRAAGDVVLGNAASMVYTAGIATEGMNYATSLITGNELGGLKYPANGGDINLVAGRDVIGAPSDQLITDWLWRIGNVNASTAANTRSTAWTVNFANFQQNIGTLGGGDLRVVAGRDVDTLSLAAPAIGRQAANATNDKTAAANDLEVIGGGNLTVNAGGDLLGGVFYAGKGRMDLISGGAVGASQATGLNPVLALGDAQARLVSRLDATLETALTPTLLPQDQSQSNRGPTSSNFSSYTDASALTLESTAGNVAIEGSNNVATVRSMARTLLAADNQLSLALRLLPGTVAVRALRGDVDINGDLTLMPTAQGSLDLLAYNDVNLNSSIILSDVAQDLIPGVDNPTGAFLNSGTVAYDMLSIVSVEADRFNAATPVRLAAAQARELRPSRITAANGVVRGSDEIGRQLYFGAPVHIYAGNDVLRLDLIAQNLTAADVSSVTAGRDIVYDIERTSIGSVANDIREITIHGPGQLSLIAGRDINLQNSAGISSRGNIANAALSDTGADINVLVGLNGHLPDYSAFEQAYVVGAQTHAEALSDYLTEIQGSRPATHETALVRFAALNQRLKAVFMQRVLLAELRAAAEYAASSDPARHGDYSRGFAALETLFPGSGGATGSGSNPYSGDLLLYFSRIYTQDGGDITLLAPGGGVNAGLAAPPSAFGISKAPEQLGIVTQLGGHIGVVTDADLQVNESRVIAVNDSDIVVWSSNGDIDAGRGAKTAISAPSPVITYDRDGHPTVAYSAALAGSGIQTRTTTSEHGAGDVVLAAPRGVVNAGDAGIVAGNLTIAATAVLGADNIKVSGVSVGVPVDTGGLGASLAGVAAAASGASSTATTSVDDAAGKQDEQAAPIAAAALSWLEVFVVGLGEEVCRQDDLDCLKRQQGQ